MAYPPYVAANDTSLIVKWCWPRLVSVGVTMLWLGRSGGGANPRKIRFHPAGGGPATPRRLWRRSIFFFLPVDIFFWPSLKSSTQPLVETAPTGSEMVRFLAILAIPALSGCVQSATGSVYYDGRIWWSTVKSASDIAGGPRQDVIAAIDRDGRIIGVYQASGPGVLQALVGSLGPAAMTAAGTAAAGALQRPSRNTTNVEMNVAGTGGAGGSGGSGGSNTTSATSAGNITNGASATAVTGALP